MKERENPIPHVKIVKRIPLAHIVIVFATLLFHKLDAARGNRLKQNKWEV
jgi:hypothetical protein